jgi:signal transduction histidine kinase
MLGTHWVVRAWQRLTLARQFAVAGLVVIAVMMVSVGWWIAREVEAGVVHRSAATTALYVDSLIAAHVQQLADGPLDDASLRTIAKLLMDTPLGRDVVLLKVWHPSGVVALAAAPSLPPNTLPFDQSGLRAFPRPAESSSAGASVSVLAESFDAEGKIVVVRDPAALRGHASLHEEAAEAFHGALVAGLIDVESGGIGTAPAPEALVEIYSPVRREGRNEVIAVVEFYQRADDLRAEVLAAQFRSWLVVGIASALAYLVLTGLVRRASHTILRQQAAMRAQVRATEKLLAENRSLQLRVGRAVTRATELNERYLGRISAELHDGPAQDVALALLRMDVVTAGGSDTAAIVRGAEAHESVRVSLQHALDEIRGVAAGLRIPDLGESTLGQTVMRAARRHERRTGSSVAIEVEPLPANVPLPIKITAYRLVQEALSNAFRHAGGVGQAVCLQRVNGSIRLTVSDAGPGFEPTAARDTERHLGIAGMRERVESLGGVFEIESSAGRGARIVATIPLGPVGSEVPHG